MWVYKVHFTHSVSTDEAPEGLFLGPRLVLHDQHGGAFVPAHPRRLVGKVSALIEAPNEAKAIALAVAALGLTPPYTVAKVLKATAWTTIRQADQASGLGLALKGATK